jgi:hypothetical protein
MEISALYFISKAYYKKARTTIIKKQGPPNNARRRNKHKTEKKCSKPERKWSQRLLSENSCHKTSKCN